MGVGVAIAAYSAYASKKGADKSAEGYEKMAEQAKERGRDQKVYNEIAATEVMAIGRMNAAEDRRQAKLIASRAVAVGSAGGSVQDIDHLIADIYGEGAYRASVSLMEAESSAAGLLFEGEQAEKHGIDQAGAYKGRAKATRLSGYTSLLQTGLKLYGGFGGGRGSNTNFSKAGDVDSGNY